MGEHDIAKRSLLNASPHKTLGDTKDPFSEMSLDIIESKTPTTYTEEDLDGGQRSNRKRDQVAFHLDSWADWVWETTANLLQLKTTGRGWTAESCSYVFAILSLCSLVVTLRSHEGKPLPEWPQLITINSIVSLCSLLMRAGVGLVLAEGIYCGHGWSFQD